MKIPQKLIKFLEDNKIKYETVPHRTVYTAYDKAATLRVKPNVIGKTLVIKTDKELVMVLIPGNKNLDLVKIKKVINGQTRLRSGRASARQGKIDFISETVMKNKFKGFKMGAVPPFGEIFGLPVFVDKLLLKEKNIFVNTGVYEISLKLSPKVFEKTGAVLANFSKAR